MGGAGTSTVAAQPLIPATSTSPKRTGKLGDVQPLTDVFVPLESIKPGEYDALCFPPQDTEGPKRAKLRLGSVVLVLLPLAKYLRERFQEMILN